MVDCYRPLTLEEALSIRKERKAIPLAGGTDLMIRYKTWSGLIPEFEDDVLFIGQLEELKEISTKGNCLRIGAVCTLSELISNKMIPSYIKNILLRMASPAVRNLATIGGNICNASPAGDILPLLYALDASLILKSIDGERELPIEEFISGPGINKLQDDEILKAVIIPENVFQINYYRKIGTRKANALAKASFTGLASIDNKRIRDIRIAFGAVSARVVRDRKIESEIRGLDRDGLEEQLDRIKNMYSELIRPINDQRSSSIYRKEVSLRLLEFFLLEELAL